MALRFWQNLSLLPEEVARNLQLIRDLDERSSACCASWQQAMREKPASQEGIAEVQRIHGECLHLSEEKISVAEQVYSLVDHQIQMLDATIDKLDRHSQSSNARTPAGRPAAPKPGAAEEDSQEKARRSGELSTKQQQQQRDLPVNPHEPVYCVCRYFRYLVPLCTATLSSFGRSIPSCTEYLQ